jgi:hypothetical protein
MARKTVRTTVALPAETHEALKKRVPARQRSRFIADAVDKKLAALDVQDALKAGLRAWKDDDHLELQKAGFFHAIDALDTWAEQQGVRPVTDFTGLLGDFWPEEEADDEFIAAVRQWRREGKPGGRL